ncbi:MAG: HDIG domain-containing protein [Verrucomicrobiales bacterium]|nr:HDIG domain-containing protein [Verrucomicrobiales bacterium]
MFDFFSQLRLKRQGFSSGKKRRKPRDSGLTRYLREGPTLCVAVLAALSAVVAFLAIYASHPLAIFAGRPVTTSLVALTLTALLAIGLRIQMPEVLRRNSRVTLLAVALLGQLLLMQFSGYLADTFAPESRFHFLVAPYAFAPMLVGLLQGRRLASLAALFAAFYGSLLIDGRQAFSFLLFSLTAGLVAAYLTHRIRRRGKLMSAGVYIGFTVVAVGFILGFIQWPPLIAVLPEAGAPQPWDVMGRQALAAIIVPTLTAILVGGLLPVVEASFRITTDISWIELADLNHPLLKRMTIEAPGTYHHSLVVANLAEAAAEAIGANATQCRVCAYFHDIGKLNKPEYFIENIGDGENPHDDLTPTMSALIVIAHVKDGVDLALKHNLNREIISVIREHHGTSLVQYFYNRALKKKDEFEALVREGQERPEDAPEVDREGFRYPGPPPQTRESAIISLADAVESASRCLQKPTPQKIEQLIDEIVRGRLREGQLDDAPLTLRDLAAIKASFYATLRSMMHNRISYPRVEGGIESRPASEEAAPREKERVSGTKSQPIKSAPAVQPNSPGDRKPAGAA